MAHGFWMMHTACISSDVVASGAHESHASASCMSAEMDCMSFHAENSMPPTVAILDLGCTRAMGSRAAVDAFCRYVDSNPSTGLWYELQPTSSRFFFANSKASKCSEKLVIYIYDQDWQAHQTEFDIVEEGNVPLLMSLPQMRNLGFQLQLTPEQAYLMG